MTNEQRELPDRLIIRLNGPLPGHESFLNHAGYDRTRLQKALDKEPAPRMSAVLIALYFDADQWHTILIRRPKYEGVHSGQIAFPGGRQEPEDTDLYQTALREFTEETGASTDDVRKLGTLTQLYIPPSRSLVTPYLAVLPGKPVFSPDPHEVDVLHTVTLNELVAPGILKSTSQLIWALGKELPVPYFDIADEVVWGATALIVSELRMVLGAEAY